MDLVSKYINKNKFILSSYKLYINITITKYN